MKKLNTSKNVLAVISGIFVTALILNMSNGFTTSTVVGIDNVAFNQDIQYQKNTPVEDTILLDSVSISLEEILRNERIENIREYLSKRNSPLAQYANEFVDAANHFNIDYRLVAAISIIESGGGKHNFKPYNAWGWGKYGFENWTDGIWSVSEGLSKYYDKGLDTPSKISKSYCPPTASVWASKVNYVMNQIGE